MTALRCIALAAALAALAAARPALAQAQAGAPAATAPAAPPQPDRLPFLTIAQPAPVPVALPAPAAEAESLTDLLIRVLAADPQVRAAQGLQRAAQERLTQARSRLGPSVYLQYSGGQGRDVETLRELTRTTDRTEAGLRWNLYNGGADQAELRGAQRDLDAADEEVRRAREDTVERLSESYVELLRLQAQLVPAAERLTAVRRLAAQVKQQQEAGKASPADLTQAEASLLDAEIAAEQLQADHASARAKLAALTGTTLRNVLPVVLPPSSGPVAGVPGLVAASRLRAEAARLRVRPALSPLAPRIDLDVRHQLADNTDPASTTTTKRSWQLVARWELPVLGESIARRNEGLRRAEAAEADAERVARGVQADLQALDARIAIGERAVEVLKRQVQQYEQLVRAGELQFDAGRRSLQQLITLRDSRYGVEQRLADQTHRLLADRMRQLALTGRLLPALGLGS